MPVKHKQNRIAQQQRAAQMPDARPALSAVPGCFPGQQVQPRLRQNHDRIGRQGRKARNEHGLVVAGKKIGHNGQAYKGRVTGRTAQRNNGSRALATAAQQLVEPVTDKINND